jgi:RNA polymerase sigma-70 factor (ECF subfamily)
VETVARNMAPVDEPGLIERAKGGDRPAFAALVDSYWDRLYRWLFHLAHDSHAAEDIAQESFLKAFTALASFQGDRFQAWLFRIAYNQFLNQMRPKQRMRLAFPENLASPEPGPDEQAMSQEALQQLARAVGRLPSEFRAPFLLRVEEDLDFREIADVLNITEETARWRVFKARQKLMEVMEPHLSGETQ